MQHHKKAQSNINADKHHVALGHHLHLNICKEETSNFDE